MFRPPLSSSLGFSVQIRISLCLEASMEVSQTCGEEKRYPLSSLKEGTLPLKHTSEKRDGTWVVMLWQVINPSLYVFTGSCICTYKNTFIV
ncbi:hypothetical protein N431DRAFT_430122 [Stipitochalara longipes BDJ]|nr:hypothetical protein N431DRAFT_430122 [Stipitochalara longipes BDJ]